MPQQRRPPVTYTRPEIREVECPTCGQLPGQPCLDRYGQLERTQNHMARWWARYRRAYPVAS
jgi:hypothetical protein